MSEPPAMPRTDRMIDKRLLGASVYDRLARDIVTGRYQPGERLNVDAIAEEFTVSRTPVREALIRLASARLVEVVRNSRTQVASWSASDMRDRLEVLGQLACLVLTDPRIDLRATRQRLDAIDAVADGDVCTGAQAFFDVCDAIGRAQPNRVACEVMRELIEPLRIFFQASVLEWHRIDLALTQQTRHDRFAEMIAALRSGGIPQMESAVGTYLASLVLAVSPREREQVG